jgi:hypothetical protein
MFDTKTCNIGGDARTTLVRGCEYFTSEKLLKKGLETGYIPARASVRRIENKILN